MFAYDKKDSYTFSFTSPDELRKYCKDNGYEIPFSKDLSLLGKELKVSTRAGEKVLKNRLVTHPMEGFDGETNGAPGELTRRRYHRFASSGAALIWSEAISIVPEGRTSDHQLFIADHNLDQFKSLMAEIREISDAPVMAQLTHSGRFSKNSSTPHPIFATRSLPFEAIRPGDKDIPVVTDDYLDRLPEIYAKAAKLAVEAGFDGIDIKACHQYLLNEVLSAHTREGKYGGSFENRSRLMLDVTDAICSVVPKDIILGSRLSLSDMIEYPYGFAVTKEKPTTPDLTETKMLVEKLHEKGVSVIDMTMGSPYFKPHVNRPYNKGGYIPPEHPLFGLERLITGAAEIQKAFPDIAMIGTGYSYLRQFAPYVAAGAIETGNTSMVGFGRMAFAYEGFAKDMISGNIDPNKCCLACSKCVELKVAAYPTGCPIRDQEVYLPLYRDLLAKKS